MRVKNYVVALWALCALCLGASVGQTYGVRAFVPGPTFVPGGCVQQTPYLAQQNFIPIAAYGVSQQVVVRQQFAPVYGVPALAQSHGVFVRGRTFVPGYGVPTAVGGGVNVNVGRGRVRVITR